MRDYRIGEIEIPIDYFKLKEEDKIELCNDLMDVMIKIIDRNVKQGVNRIYILDKMLESSINTNVEDENYEVAAVLHDIRNLLNEQTS